MPVMETDVIRLVNQAMGDICENHYDTHAQNHCAHFVSHALRIGVATVCGDLTAIAAARGTGATVRCNELFNSLPVRGAWPDRPIGQIPLLVFVTFKQNVSANIMGAMPSKHVGIWFTERVYNFSNSNHIVTFDRSPDEFLARVGGSYEKAHKNLGQTALYYAVPPC